LISDAVIDGLKVGGATMGKDRNPQPQSGTPVSDKIIDTLKFGRNPEVRAHAQIDSKSDDKFTQMSSGSKGKELVQSSDVINDVLKKVEGTNSNAETGKDAAKPEK
jgi:hypothetical protein